MGGGAYGESDVICLDAVVPDGGILGSSVASSSHESATNESWASGDDLVAIFGGSVLIDKVLIVSASSEALSIFPAGGMTREWKEIEIGSRLQWDSKVVNQRRAVQHVEVRRECKI